MDYETVPADAFGRSLRGLGLNLLVRDVAEELAFLTGVLGLTAHRISREFAIVTGGGALVQIHADATYHANPLLGLLPETPPRGAGIELRLYDVDPDTAAAQAEAQGAPILQPPTDKPHGLREAFLLSPNGYCWVPSRPLP